jgi:hypothetical protein
MWITIAILAVGFAAFASLAYKRNWHWTGFGEKSLWDWLSLLVVPVGLSLVVFKLDDGQSQRERTRAEATARNVAVAQLDRQRADDLDTYIGRMSDLMLDRDLTHSAPGSDVTKLASTLTTTVLPRLDGRRKAEVLLFLNRSRLLDPRGVALDLSHADFERLDARGMRFPRRSL